MIKLSTLRLWLLMALFPAVAAAEGGGTPPPTITSVHTGLALRAALQQAGPGKTILVAPGNYRGGFGILNMQGRPDAWITVCAADPAHKPVIRGGNDCLKFSGAAYVELRDLVFEASNDNGLNMDDGDRGLDTHDILLRNLEARNLPKSGNHDGIKLSGINRFRVEGCVVENWGGDGQAIDMVGCHDGVIENCDFRHAQGNSSSACVQIKGMSRNVVVRSCRFQNVGARAVQLGGVTGLEFFRPKLPDTDGYEAKDCVVEHCTFTGSEAVIAFVTADGCAARFNTIYCPTKWIIRILQESRGPRFVSCRNGEFTNNIVVFRSKQFESTVNIGDETRPETFKFANNFWYCVDDPARSAPQLPAPETDGVVGKDPLLTDPERGDLSLKPDSPAVHAGAHATE